MNYKNTIVFAQGMDLRDPLKDYRSQFHFPQKSGKDVLYFCGNSLGLMPKTTAAAVNKELNVWEKEGVLGPQL